MTSRGGRPSWRLGNPAEATAIGDGLRGNGPSVVTQARHTRGANQPVSVWRMCFNDIGQDPAIRGQSELGDPRQPKIVLDVE